MSTGSVPSCEGMIKLTGSFYLTLRLGYARNILASEAKALNVNTQRMDEF